MKKATIKEKDIRKAIAIIDRKANKDRQRAIIYNRKKQKLLAKIMKLLKEYDPGAMIQVSEKLFGFPIFITQQPNIKSSVVVAKTKKLK